MSYGVEFGWIFIYELFVNISIHLFIILYSFYCILFLLPVDVLVTTPNRLVFILNQDPPLINLEK